MHHKVSIIISSYNGAPYIGETIESVINQTYDNWELLIVDDGSTDETEQVVASFHNERVRLIRAGRIGRNGRIKNIGLDNASGDMIAFIDHDDLWASNKLEVQVRALQQYPEAGFCLVNGYNFKEKGKPVSFFYQQQDGVKVDNVFLSFFQSRLSAWTQTLLMRRECLQAGRFNETGLFVDPEFIINLASHFKAVIWYEPLVFHRQHQESYSTVNWIPCHQQGINIIEKYKNNKMLPAVLANDALFKSHINFGEKYIVRKEPLNAISHFLKAWRYKIFSLAPFKKSMKAILYTFR